MTMPHNFDPSMPEEKRKPWRRTANWSFTPNFWGGVAGIVFVAIFFTIIMPLIVKVLEWSE